MRLQRIACVRQHFPDRRLPDVAAAVRSEMGAADWAAAVKPGSRIAIGVGSRGVANISVIARAVVDYWSSRDAQPFIIPVMGSHGAGTAQGQANVLAKYGITEKTMGCPIVSSLDVVEVGTTPEGIEVVMDRAAYESDGVMLCARVKWHTDFDGKLESGIHKMMAIGLGKWAGAQRYHTHAYKLGLEQVIRGVGRVILDTGKMLGGMAILEDAYHNTAEVRAVGAREMVGREEALLERDQFRALAQRAQADLENYKRRAAEEREELRRFGQSQVMLKVLGVADDFQRAFEIIPDDAVAPGWREGLDLVRRGIDHLLETEGVTVIQAKDKPFQPSEHEAVFFEETTEHEGGRVLSVIRNGYIHNGRVLRAAQVTVSKEPRPEKI